MSKIRKNLFEKLNVIKKQTKNLSEGYRLFFLFLCGMFLGTILINLFGANCCKNISIYGKFLADNNENIDLVMTEKSKYFAFCWKKYLFQALVVIAINLTSKGKMFNSLLCFYKGVVISILICAATISYGKGGLVIFLFSIFPHYLIYVPLFIYTIGYGMALKKVSRNKEKRFFAIKGLSLEFVLLIGTAFLEAYGNLVLLNNVF